VDNLVENTQLLIAFNALTLTGVLVYLRLRGSPVNLVVPAMFLTFSIQMLANFNFASGGPAWISASRFSLGFVYGPLFYFYTREFLDERSTWSRTDYLHLLPAIFAPTILRALDLGGAAIGLTILASLGIYLALAGFELAFKGRDSLEAGRRSWIWSMLAIGASILVINIATVILDRRVVPNLHSALELALFASILLLVSAFVIAGLTDPALLMRNITTKVLKSSLLDDSACNAVMDRLEPAFTDGSLALDEPLTLTDLARIARQPARQVSLVIQQQTGFGVPDWLNMKRVRAVEVLLARPENDGVTVLDLAFEAGFNSKATFNRAFKRHTGKSPSVYRQDQNRI